MWPLRRHFKPMPTRATASRHTFLRFPSRERNTSIETMRLYPIFSLRLPYHDAGGPLGRYPGPWSTILQITNLSTTKSLLRDKVPPGSNLKALLFSNKFTFFLKIRIIRPRLREIIRLIRMSPIGDKIGILVVLGAAASEKRFHWPQPFENFLQCYYYSCY